MLISLVLLTALSGESKAVQFYRQGLEYLKGQQYYRAIELFKLSLAENPGFVDPMKGLAEAFYSLAQYDEALKYSRMAGKYDARSADLKVLEAKILVGLGQLDDAQKLLLTILTAEPHNLEARIVLAEIDLIRGKNQEAAQEFLKVLSIDPDNIQALINLALLYETSGDDEKALIYLRLALQNYTDDPRVYYAAGKYYYHHHDLTSAESYLNTALLLKADYFDALQLMGEIKFIEKDYAKALELFQKILGSEVERHQLAARYTLGIVYAKLGDFRKAFLNFQESVNLKPDNEIAVLTAENVCLKNPDTTLAWARLYSRSRIERARLWERSSQYAKARYEYRRAIQLDQSSKEARLGFAATFRVLGFPLKYLSELLILNRDYKYTDTNIVDDIDIYKSYYFDSLAYQWIKYLKPSQADAMGAVDSELGLEPQPATAAVDTIFDQYSVKQNVYRLGVFTIGEGNTVFFPEEDQQLLFYIQDVLKYFRRLNVLNTEVYAASFDQAYATARQLNTDYFLVVAVKEDTRSVAISCDIYLTRTAAKIYGTAVYRTGNDKFQSACLYLAEKLEAALPRKGLLLARQLNMGLINMGKADGVKTGDKFYIIKKLTLSPKELALSYAPEDVLGEIEITAVDESIAVGKITPKGYFDLINIYDELLPQ